MAETAKEHADITERPVLAEPSELTDTDLDAVAAGSQPFPVYWALATAGGSARGRLISENIRDYV